MFGLAANRLVVDVAIKINNRKNFMLRVRRALLSRVCF